MKQPVAVLFGGVSPEREVSLHSGQAVLDALRQLGRQPIAIDTAVPLRDWLQMDIGCAFVALHGSCGEDGSVQGVLEMAQIPYTGSGVLASALAMDKWCCRQVLRHAGLAVPNSLRLSAADGRDNKAACTELGDALFVKPNAQGSSLGCSRVGGNHSTLEDALDLAFRYGNEVLVESWIEGGEYAIGILGDQVLPPIRIEAAGDFYDYEAKYQDTSTQYHLPCGLDEDTERHIRQMAMDAWRAIGGAGWGRVDIMQSGADWLVVEINTVPGLTKTSLVPQAAAHIGMDFAALVGEILALAETGKANETAKTHRGEAS